MTTDTSPIAEIHKDERDESCMRGNSIDPFVLFSASFFSIKACGIFSFSMSFSCNLYVGASTTICPSVVIMVVCGVWLR